VQAIASWAILRAVSPARKWSTYMSGTAVEKVRSEALNLPKAERAELAYNLVVSLDGKVPPI
jgi:hypothetical protein